MIEITSGDFLAGGGGVTEAMTNVTGLKVRWVLNHDPIAIRTNMHNHKGVKHFLADFYTQDEHEMELVDFVWASIECTQHSRANGGREKKIGSYTLGMELTRYIKFLQPLVIGIENVPEFKEWAPLLKGQPDITRKGEQFEIWKNTICNMGYDYHELICNAADYGIPTRRVRYFAFFTKKHLQMEVRWPAPTHSKEGKNGLKKWEACRKYIDLENEGNSIFGRELNPNVIKGKRHPLSENTLKRIAGGIRKYAPELAFIFQYYGSGLNIQSVDSPLNTITSKDRHVLVTMEKVQFIADYYGRDDTAHSIDGPANTITCENSKHLITFVTDHTHTDNYHSLDEPMNPILTRQTKQFISLQYNSNGNPEANNQSIDDPLQPIVT
ncbi:MAG: DNA cytosine methyltransferase, partial [Bacteroidales bacterium]